MKIVFVLGSLEPKKNGVADYCYAISKQINLLGHQTFLISWNDVYIPKGKWILNKQTLRLPTNLNQIKRKALIANALNQFQPDCVSIQFVLYSYHVKGLPLNLSQTMQIFKKYPIHIMFHELWVSANYNSTLKEKTISLVQKGIVTFFINQMEPKIITTNTQQFQQMLLPQKASILPLFGNIDIIAGRKKTESLGSNLLKVIVFGNLTSDKSGFEEQIIWLRQYAFQIKKKIEITFIGNNGSKKDSYLQFIKKHLINAIILDLGEMESKKISYHIFNAHLAISKANFENLGKSGSTLTILEHGVTVLLRGKKNPALLNQIPKPWYIDQLLFTSDKPMKLIEPSITVNNQKVIAQKFVSLLEKAVAK